MDYYDNNYGGDNYGNDDMPMMRATDMDSFIELIIHNDDKPFLAGSDVSGIINVYAKETIPNVKQISLTLNGEE